ncbi:LysM peptidoglycan-binding domain-containing protein [Rossellomorea aquimaris]|uniref:LysM peptidoglycan-binding domain-containing protein n=1 Tax=Rossellomorea aquimaris TaxID=189382 RepID=UPI001CD5B5D0|nr:LysM peptidoglycan-binding domain-containing protein [Rossellomorea aquimaris]MCA1053976.1 LysM peptidoglycan-binding domain-containing protein [Rossellomorea aquimaris]
MPTIQSKGLIYTVKPGNTLYGIAAQFGSTITAIERANHLYPPVTDRGLIFPGDVLVVPTSASNPLMNYIVTSGDTLSAIAQTFDTHVDLLAGVNSIPNPDLILVDQQLLVPAFSYKIVTGDSLYSISRRFGVSVSDIEDANTGRPGFQRDVIWPDFHLIVPIPTSRNIFVTKPLPGNVINSGQSVQGFARVFEAVVNYQLRDQNGVIVTSERYAMTDEGAPAYGFFNAPLSFNRPPTTASGELWVYSRSAKDGSIQDLVKIKVYF